ncbi:hypothetical protein SBP18_03460 [Rhodoferax ferrireducens]|uniref:hypothetical protein n=1 Tax=Rhodoferax ferrireducens TaxID=192843 RepID=UPI00298D6EAE|nr:hypothetical protein [Rhodoferax ferrireducens]WPC67575.1 hypothetical protein SBP18_03460 [Rhodoferax ferrireducens]
MTDAEFEVAHEWYLGDNTMNTTILDRLMRRGQLSCPQDGPVDSRCCAPVRQLPTAPRRLPLA